MRTLVKLGVRVKEDHLHTCSLPCCGKSLAPTPEIICSGHLGCVLGEKLQGWDFGRDKCRGIASWRTSTFPTTTTFWWAIQPPTNITLTLALTHFQTALSPNNPPPTHYHSTTTPFLTNNNQHNNDLEPQPTSNNLHHHHHLSIKSTLFPAPPPRSPLTTRIILPF